MKYLSELCITPWNKKYNCVSFNVLDDLVFNWVNRSKTPNGFEKEKLCSTKRYIEFNIDSLLDLYVVFGLFWFSHRISRIAILSSYKDVSTNINDKYQQLYPYPCLQPFAWLSYNNSYELFHFLGLLQNELDRY